MQLYWMLGIAITLFITALYSGLLVPASLLVNEDNIVEQDQGTSSGDGGAFTNSREVKCDGEGVGVCGIEGASCATREGVSGKCKTFTEGKVTRCRCVLLPVIPSSPMPCRPKGDVCGKDSECCVNLSCFQSPNGNYGVCDSSNFPNPDNY